MSAKDGGPAFPKDGAAYSEGMSLRAWFAGQALPVVIAAYVEANGHCIGADHFPMNCSAHAVRMADALIAELDK